MQGMVSEVLVGIEKNDKEQVSGREPPVPVPGAGVETATRLLPSTSAQADLPGAFLQGSPGGQTGVGGKSHEEVYFKMQSLNCIACFFFVGIFYNKNVYKRKMKSYGRLGS